MARVLCLILFASGAAGLVFETLWFHQAGIAFGSSVWASSLVLSGFMAGLAAGSLLVGRFGDDLRRPVLAYGLLEALIAVSGVLLIVVIPIVGPSLAPWFGSLRAQPWILNPIRLAVVFALLLVPSTAMGATLPLLTKALMAIDRNFGQALGRLYGWNTLGAVAGTLAAAGPLVAYLGVRGAGLVAAGLNASAAVGAVALASRWPGGGSAPRSAEAREPAGEDVSSVSIAAVVFCQPALAAFGAGFVLLALEVVWFRYMLLFVPGTSTVFGWMLAVVLTGIALGGFVASRALRRRPDFERGAAVLALLAGVACVASYATFLPVATSVGLAYVDDSKRAVTLALALMLPTSLLSGAFFVAVGAVIKRRVASAVVAAGTLTFVNTTGAALGALAGGFLLLPHVGMERSVALLALGYAAIGLSFAMDPVFRSRWLYVALGLCVVAAALFPYGSLDREVLQSVVERRSRGMEQRLVEVREGLTETVAYVENRVMGRPHSYTLVTNGFGMSDTHWFARRYMKVYVYLPVALHPQPRSALLISYGVGSTAKALTDTASLQTIDVVDISREILDMGRVVYPAAGDHPLNDPRVQVQIEDGRYFLETTPRSYDLITAEPPPPRLAGVVNLYTREYFALIRGRLNEGGFTTYWLPIHALTNSGTRSIIRGFCDVFEDCTLWSSGSYDLMLVGSRNAKGPVSSAQFSRQWRDPVAVGELVRLGFETPEQLGTMFIGGSDYLREIVGDTPALVDDFPRRIVAPGVRGDEPSAMRTSFLDTNAARERFARSEFVSRFWEPGLRQSTLASFELQEIVNRIGYGLYTSPEQRIVDLHRVQSESALRVLPLWLMGSDGTLQRIAMEAAQAPPYPDELGFHLAAGSIAARDFETGANLMGGFRSRNPGDLRAMMLEVYALAMAGRLADAARRLSERREVYERHAPRYIGWFESTFPSTN